MWTVAGTPRRPDLVILLDSPELHLKLARRARQLGLPVLYYIAPQTWASRAYRNRQIIRDVNRLACILPFEDSYFHRFAPARCRAATQSPERERGVSPSSNCARERFRAEFVGHPLFEALRRERPLPETVDFLRYRAAGRPIIALLPGSRRHVIETMLPLQLEVLRRLRAALRADGQDVYAAVSCVSEERRGQIRDALARASDSERPRARAQGSESADRAQQAVDLGIDIVFADNASLLTAADLVLVASGTATLHVAYYRKPMIVVYDAGRVLYWPHRLLGRYFLTTRHLSLVNLLADARIVPEFMPFIRSRDLPAIATVAHQLLTDQTWRQLMIRQLDDLVRPLENSQASANVCRIMADLLSMPDVSGGAQVCEPHNV